MEWILIVIITGMTPVTAEFNTQFACRTAGKGVVADFPKEGTAVFHCFPKGN